MKQAYGETGLHDDMCIEFRGSFTAIIITVIAQTRPYYSVTLSTQLLKGKTFENRPIYTIK
jgi:hypothetical protein